jgi:hypothetical protein
VLDNETLNYPISNFFSFEPSCVFLKPINNNVSLKFQLGLSICQKVLTHEYSFQEARYSYGQMQKAVKDHPVSLPINFSFGILFKGNAIQKRSMD